jgi:predicted Zn-dependent protease
VSGYSQTFEFHADREAGRMLLESGYEVKALSRLIERLPSRAVATDSGSGYAKTHPEPVSRVEALAAIIPEPSVNASFSLAVSTPNRQERFEAMRVLF